MPVNTAFLSGDTTVFSNISLNDGRLLATRVSSVTVTPTTALDLRTGPGVISMATVADSNGMTIGQLRLVFQASGMSLVYSSGATVYTVGASAVSAAQA